ncbi:MAG: metalloregulator ArsR/SmtB family transcription factor [Oceanicaulis sp.]|jgi:ubiquinone/menaquinone biosynthesis C-methylase UbiE/DNA-binding HxlR family transcriptional regulator|nr:metalloregulator ArsR/SmtB family transcription factor [Oceanicaulis sp.]
MQSDLLAKLKALAEPTRLRIVSLLAQGELTVSEIMQVLGQSQPRISRHLKLLADAGLCERFPEGGWVFYRLMRTGPVSRLAALVEEFTEANEPQVHRDRQRLQELKRLRAEEAAKYFEAAAQEWSQIRSLHFSDAEVEAAMLDLAEGRRFKQHVDVGTGTGRILELFIDQADEGMGVDLSREMLHVARAKLTEAGLSSRFVRQADASALPLDEGAADLVTLHQVLHYLPDPQAALSECARVLAPGGLLLVVDFAEHHHETLRIQHHHRWLGFPPAQVTAWLQTSGLTLKSLRTLEPEGIEGGLTVLIWAAERPIEGDQDDV